MIKSKFKRVTSLFLATLMCVTTFAGIGSTTAYAASGEKADVYMVDFPRDGDANYDGVWGHSKADVFEQRVQEALKLSRQMTNE